MKNVVFVSMLHKMYYTPPYNLILDPPLVHINKFVFLGF